MFAGLSVINGVHFAVFVCANRFTPAQKSSPPFFVDARSLRCTKKSARRQQGANGAPIGWRGIESEVKNGSKGLKGFFLRAYRARGRLTGCLLLCGGPERWLAGELAGGLSK